MKSRSAFELDLLLKVHSACGYTVSERHKANDVLTIRRRVVNEGLKFLTVALPSFGKAVLRGIESNAFIPPSCLRRRKKGSLLPAFLQGWTRQLFNDDGSVKDHPDPLALQELLQITMLCYKLELPYSKEEEAKVLQGFVNTESEIPATSEEVSLDPDVVSLARHLLFQVFRGFDHKSILPGHGPGAVATGERGNGKYSFKRKFQRLHQEFPYYRYFAPSLSGVSFESGWYGRLEPTVLPVAKVCLVPKDSRGPRLISMEPLEVQWIQQGLLKKLVPHLESHPLTKGRINFTKQSFNQELAWSSSMDRKFCTLDLKDASDRVSVALLEKLYPSFVLKWLLACRSVATRLPDGTIMPLRKHAPMGSALCFPIMALTIWALVEATNRLKHREHNSHFLVYGDDIIVATHQWESTVNVLEAASLKVNTDKSFRSSHFRESCGMDAFLGTVVTPIRLRKTFNCGHPDYSVRSHLIALSESFFDKGLWEVTSFLRGRLNSFGLGRVPWTTRRTDWSYFCPDPQECSLRNRGAFKRRWNSRLQRFEFLVPVTKPEKEDSFIADYPTGRLLKALTKRYEFAVEDYQVTIRKSGVVRPRWAVV